MKSKNLTICLVCFLTSHSMSNHQMVPCVTPQILLQLKPYDVFIKKKLSWKFQLHSSYGSKIITLCIRLIMLWLLYGKSIINVVCVYVCSSTWFLWWRKRSFYEQLLVLVTSVAPSKTLVIAGDFNHHVGQHNQDSSQHHGGYGYGTRNQEGMRILIFVLLLI